MAPVSDLQYWCAMSQQNPQNPQLEDERLLPIAKHVIERCGGFRTVATITGRSLPRIYYWTYPRTKRGGTGGIIPADAQISLMNAAMRGEVDLEPRDFFIVEHGGKAK